MNNKLTIAQVFEGMFEFKNEIQASSAYITHYLIMDTLALINQINLGVLRELYKRGLVRDGGTLTLRNNGPELSQ